MMPALNIEVGCGVDMTVLGELRIDAAAADDFTTDASDGLAADIRRSTERPKAKEEMVVSLPRYGGPLQLSFRETTLGGEKFVTSTSLKHHPKVLVSSVSS